MAQASGNYQPATFKSSCFKNTIENLAACWGCTPDKFKLEAHYTYETASDSKEITLSEAYAVAGIISPLDRLNIVYRTKNTGTINDYYCVSLEEHIGGIMVNVNTPDLISAQNSLNIIVENLGLSQVELVFSDDILFERIGKIEERLVALEKEIAKQPLKCFLSFRFSDHSVAVAREIEQYLTLLGVKVITGSEYEPRRIEDKVRSRILSGVDFVVYIITKDGESAWIRDEIATATAHDAFPIPLVEEGNVLESGLLGNVEYIPFAPNHPGDSWIRLAQAVQYIATVRSQQNKDEV